MKITLKSLISLCLSVLLLISAVACNSPVETSTGNDTTAGMTEETTEITEGHFETSEEIVTTETEDPNAVFNALLPQAFDLWYLYELGQIDLFLVQTLFHPSEQSNRTWDSIWEYRLRETAKGVYMGTQDLRYLIEEIPDGTLILCNVFLQEVMEAFWGDSTATTGYATPCMTRKEFLPIFEEYRSILDDNGAIYFVNTHGEPATHWGDDDDVLLTFSCLLTKEQILNFEMPDDKYIVITYFAYFK